MLKRVLFLVAVCGFTAGPATAAPLIATQQGNGTQIEYAGNSNPVTTLDMVVIPVSVALLGLT